ncbi:10 kda heat shock protein [Anaeramoeba flamelloides]|uniref:10 kDa heat shock protein n=1 Tax=Anaeramoeba flamelloides TaxID=1746091 RepID=A0ABQ8Y927_9EUKA|nr:10 kda heat shock protein [Anaeramoeba flamelloides]
MLSPFTKSLSTNHFRNFATKVNFKPLFNRILIDRVEESKNKKTTSGLFIPDSAKQPRNIGTIVALGDGQVTRDGKRNPMNPNLKVGVKVLLPFYGGTEIELEGREYSIWSEWEVLAVIED